MASRVYQIGTIVSRTKWLLQAGVLKQEPIWLEVVEAFPPEVFPAHNRIAEKGRAPTIVYPEDRLRKAFHKKYIVIKQPDKTPLSLFEEAENTSICSRFVSEQVHRLSQGEDKAEAARGALWKLRSEGVDIRVKQVKPATAEEATSTLNNLRTLLQQMHSKPSPK